MSKKSVKVAAIEIQYPDGETKKISVDDAKELHRQLEELFGEKTVPIRIGPYYPQPRDPIVEPYRWPSLLCTEPPTSRPLVRMVAAS